MRLWIAFVLLLIGLLPSWSEAATINATTCSYADVNTAVTTAVHGDTVQVPVGTCTWTSTLAFTNKSITIKGAGRSSTRAQCTPSQTTYTCILSVNPIIDWTTVDAGNTPTGLSVLRDFTFDSPGVSSGTCSTYGLASLIFEGFSKNIRITNNTIIYEACWGISVKKPYGVIDHNKFISYKGAKHGLHVLYTGSTTNFIYGDESWSRASSLGSEVNVFVEDNTFESDPSVLVVAPSEGSYFTDHFLGGRIVHRFNTITDGNFAQHGTESGGRGRGFREHETYRNNWVWTSSSTTATLTGFRGGTGRLFENTATGLMSRFAGFSTYRAGPIPGDTNGYPWALCRRQTATSVTSSGTTATVVVPSNHGISPPTSTAKAYMTISGASPSGYNGVAVKATRVDATTFTYPVAAGLATPATGTILVMGAFDGNTDSTGYPCLDQVGYGKSVLLAGNGPDVTPDVTPAGWPTQGLEPVYCFKNMIAGVLNACAAATAGSDVIVSLRDFYNQHASFDGVTNHGVGYGSRASRPASCTTGDAWWATNDATNWNISTTETYSANIAGLSSGADGALDICTATNTWTDTTNATCTGLNCYVPYTYPHPLVQGDAPPAPTNPTGVRVIGTTTATSVTITWTPSTASDFKSYRIYHGLAPGSYTLPMVTITKALALAAHTPLAQHTFQSPIAGTHYFVVTEVNTQDLESAVSSEVSVALTGLSRTAVGGAVLASDTFDGTGATLGANWSANAATNVFQRVSDIATTTDGANDTAARYSAVTWPNDQRSAVVYNNVLTTGGLGAGYGPAVRMSTSGTTATYYRFVGSTAGWAVVKMVANSGTTLASSATPAFADGDNADLEMIGTTLRAKHNGTVVATVTDASITSGAAGICYSSTGGNSTTGITSWQGLSAGVARP